MNAQNTASRAVVIGAGVGGIAATLKLTAAGIPVTVLELGHEPGGKSGTTTHDGLSFDTGPSLLTMTDVFDDLLAGHGTSLRELVTLVDPQPAFRYLWGDGAALAIGGRLETTLANTRAYLGSAAAEELEAFLRYSKQIWDAAAPAFVYGPAPSLGGVARLGFKGLQSLARIDAGHTMADAIWRRVANPYLRDVLLRYATYNGSDPRVAPATLNCIAWVELGLGGWGVEGGMNHLMRRLVEVAERAGAEFRYNTRVDRIVTRDGRVVGVEADGAFVAADRIVSNVDVAHLRDDLTAARAPQSKWNEPSTSGFNLVVRTARRSDRAAHTVIFPSDYLQEFVDLFDHRRVPVDPTVYVCAGEVAHRRRGWVSDEALFVMANAPAVMGDHHGEGPQYEVAEQAVLQRLVAHGQVAPDAAVVWRRTPAELAARFPGSSGAIYGDSSNSRLAAFRRMPNRHPSIGGLYVASGSAHPGGGVPMAALSGRMAATQALADIALVGT